MSQEALDKAKEIEDIKARVREEYSDFDWPEPIMEPVYFGRFEKQIVQDRKLILDQKTGVQWDVVSDRYELIPHEVVLDNLVKSCPSEFGKPAVKLRSWSKGACFRAEASFPEAGLDVEIKVGDIVRPRIISYSSYNRSTFYGIEVGGEQLVCGNGMVRFVAENSSKRKHILTATEPEVMESMIGSYLSDWSNTTGLWKKWANTLLSVEEIEVISEQLPFSEKEREKIMELPLLSNNGENLKSLGSKATMWDLNSAATQYVKHELKSDKRSVELEADIARIMIGLEDN
jgi:hypothetical protein